MAHYNLFYCSLTEKSVTSGGLRNDLLTPDVRFIPCVTPLLVPSPPIESSDSCLGFTTPALREMGKCSYYTHIRMTQYHEYLHSMSMIWAFNSEAWSISVTLGTANRKPIFPKRRRAKTNIDQQAEPYGYRDVRTMQWGRIKTKKRELFNLNATAQTCGDHP